MVCKVRHDTCDAILITRKTQTDTHQNTKLNTDVLKARLHDNASPCDHWPLASTLNHVLRVHMECMVVLRSHVRVYYTTCHHSDVKVQPCGGNAFHNSRCQALPHTNTSLVRIPDMDTATSTRYLQTNL